MPALFLGIDGGQSSTTALIGDDRGNVLGCGRGGPCNHVAASEGRAKFFSAIETCLAQACRDASLDPDGISFDVVCAGFSGGPADKEKYLQQLIPSRQQFVTTDALIALSGATGGAPGIIAIAGTGSISWGRNAERRVARVGGWGYIFGDEGGSFDIARQALRAILRHEEGWGPETALREALLTVTGAASANDLLHRFYTPEFPRPKIASYSRLVDETAMQGDAVARNILLSAAQQLASAASAVRAQIFHPGEQASVAPIGGAFRSQILAERFGTLVQLEEGNKLIQPLFGPATGALIEAWFLAGLRPQLRNAPREKA